jgi:toxin secretion/phage lysis holin
MQSYADQFKLDNVKSIFSNIIAHAWVKIGIGGVAWFLDFVFSMRQEAVAVIGILLLLDTVSGVAKAYKEKNLGSRGMFRFATKFCVYFTLIVTGRLVDKVIPIQFAAPLMESFLAITEALSIMENLKVCGFAVPTKLIDRLEDVRGKDIARPKAKAKSKNARRKRT